MMSAILLRGEDLTEKKEEINRRSAGDVRCVRCNRTPL